MLLRNIYHAATFLLHIWRFHIVARGLRFASARMTMLQTGAAVFGLNMIA